MNELLIKAGFSTANTFYSTASELSFWSTPLGLLCTFVLCITSIYRVLHKRSRCDAFDTFWHLLMSLTTGAAFFSSWQHTPPQNVIKTMIILMAVRGVYKALKTRKHQPQRV